jgi:hypothetical protein
MRSRRSSCTLAVATTGLALLAACGGTVNPPAAIPNVLDTVTLYALAGTPIATPSAFSILGNTVIRTDLSGVVFDFAFNFDSVGEPVLLPVAAIIGSTPDTLTLPGLMVTTTPFADITVAPTGGYEVNKPLVVSVGNVVLVRSHFVNPCPDGSANSLYGKLAVLAIDATARTIELAVLVDQNCAYLGLSPGTPTQ